MLHALRILTLYWIIILANLGQKWTLGVLEYTIATRGERLIRGRRTLSDTL